MTGSRLLGMRRVRRSALLVAAFGLLVLLWQRGLGPYGSGFPPIGGTDFVQYWSAAQLLLRGTNPYDPVALLAVERAVDWPGAEVLRMWNPPWTLVLVVPLALLPFGLATLVWLYMQVLLILGSGVLLWRYFAPGDNRHWIGLALAIGFVPGLLALRMGQISPWLLAGVVGFLSAERARRDVLAGSALALLMVKPHVTYLFWLAALWWVWQSRRWRVAIGWLSALAAASALVLLFVPSVFGNYLQATAEPPLYWATCTLGTWLRTFVRPSPPWLHFLPSAAGALILLAWLCRQRGPWCWDEITAPFLLASALTTAFGWSTDQVVLLPVVVAVAGRLRWASTARRALGLAAWAASGLGLWLVNHWQIGDHYSVWHAPALAGLYWWGVGRDRGYREDDLPYNSGATGDLPA